MEDFIEEQIKELLGERKDFIKALGGSMEKKIQAVDWFNNAEEAIRQALHSAYRKGYEQGAQDGTKMQVITMDTAIKQSKVSHKE